FLDIGRDLGNALDRAVRRDDLVLHIVVPQAELHEVFQQVFVHHYEFSAQYAAGVDVGSIRFEALVVAQDLRSGGGGHGGQQQGVAHAVLFDFGFQAGPVPAVGRLHVPHIVLQDAFGNGRSFVGSVFAFGDGEIF